MALSSQKNQEAPSRRAWSGWFPAAAFVAAVACSAVEAEAQLVGQDRLAASTTFGITVPRGDMGYFYRPGPTFGLQLMYELSPRLAVGLDTGFDSFDGKRTPNTIFTGPPSQFLRYGVGAEFALLPSRPGAFTVVTGAGVGMATVLSESMYNPMSPGGVVGGPGTTVHSSDPLRFEGSYVTGSALLRVGYVADATTTLFLEGHGYTTSLDADKTIVFIQGDPSLVAPTSMMSLGFRLGLRKAF
jgi:hypothetical protein